MRMTVERSIPNRSAASPWLSSPVTSCNHSSYFWLGLRNRLARRPSRSRPESCWVISTLLLGAGGPYRMRCNQNPDVGHEVRRKTGVRVFDGLHSALRGPSDVVVRGATIESVGPAGEPVPAGPDVRVIDGGGRVLMPGLIDAHWHTTFVAVSAGVALTADPGYLHL